MVLPQHHVGRAEHASPIGFTLRGLVDWQERQTVFEGLAAYDHGAVNLAPDDGRRGYML
ncbi:MAG: hypothetical protein GY856_08560 [bacterium]|nr:hypothetical protein [bacterium]